MINRELIRLKAVQIAYAFNENPGKTTDVAEKELFFSLSKAHELYLSMLSLMVSLNHIARRSVEVQQARVKRLNEDTVVSPKFINNRFLMQLESNEQLQEFRESQSFNWADEEEFLRRLYNRILEQGFYIEYMSSNDSSYEEDREVWRKIYRTLLCNNEELDSILEEQSLYWNDDKVIVDTFVLKTIRRFEAENGEGQELLPEFKSNEDREFASKLFRTAVTNAETYNKMLSEQTANWDLSRIARMDLIIMQLAIAELFAFPEIPASVTINEYVEIAKAYSTPRSGSYVNGMLDALCKKLQSEGKLIKNA